MGPLSLASPVIAMSVFVLTFVACFASVIAVGLVLDRWESSRRYTRSVRLGPQ